ncbi:MAG: hypothetical protein MUF37_08495, partial [Methanoregulaceae archaeon]|nr:hypothetical protein [Methanoregulaceae archaeon]
FSVLFVSSALGRWLLGLLKVEIKDWYAFIIGFVLLSILFRIPIAGIFILLLTISLGFGGLIYTVHGHWKEITGTNS